MGERFRDALTRKAKEGVQVRILIDSWGKGPVSDDFFEGLIRNGGEVKFFEKIKIIPISLPAGTGVTTGRSW